MENNNEKLEWIEPEVIDLDIDKTETGTGGFLTDGTTAGTATNTNS